MWNTAGAYSKPRPTGSTSHSAMTHYGGGGATAPTYQSTYQPTQSTYQPPPYQPPSASRPPAMPAYQPPSQPTQPAYQPGPIPAYQPRPQPSQVASQMTKFGTELMNPNSAYMKRMREMLTGRIGEETEAQKRLAAFEAAQSGYGTGESAELGAMLGDIGIGGLEATGQAFGETALQGPGMGLDALKAAMSGELGISGQDLDAWRTLQTLQQQQREAAMGGAYRGRELDLEQQRLGQEALFNQFALMFG